MGRMQVGCYIIDTEYGSIQACPYDRYNLTEVEKYREIVIELVEKIKEGDVK